MYVDALTLLLASFAPKHKEIVIDMLSLYQLSQKL